VELEPPSTTDRDLVIPTGPVASQGPQMSSPPASLGNMPFTSEPEALPAASQTAANASRSNTLPPCKCNSAASALR
jgi:hypothetical protein